MLDKLRAETLALIAATRLCTLSTVGPAGVQASVVECLVYENCLYVLVPSTADHLFNIQHAMEVVLTASFWQVRAAALALGGENGPRGTVPCELSACASTEGGSAGVANCWPGVPRELSACASTEEYTLVEVFPIRIHLLCDN